MTAMTREEVLDRVLGRYRSLSPQLRQAAQYVLDNPNEVGLNSMRQLASAARVKPNTLVRMAKALDFKGYEEFRSPFRDTLRRGVESYPNRARWLQHLSQGKSHGQLFSQLASTCISNVETLFSTIASEDLQKAADMIIHARTAYILGMGGCYSLVHSFYYVGRMALDNLVLVPQQATLPIDDLARIGEGDVLLAATSQPYRRETVEATRLAKQCGAKLISLTDSRTSPIALDADVVFIAPTATPQFFPSTMAMLALLESLLAFVVADADDLAVRKIERFHRKRFETSVYWVGERDL